MGLNKQSKKQAKGSSAVCQPVHTHTHSCPAASGQFLVNRPEFLAGLQSQTQQPLGLQPVCMSLLPEKGKKHSLHRFCLLDCHVFILTDFTVCGPE